MAATLSVTKGVDTPLIPGVWRQAGIRLKWAGAAPAGNVRVSYAVTAPAGGSAALQYRDSADGEWKNMPATGYYGSTVGFQITDDYDVTSALRVKATAGTGTQGTWTMQTQVFDGTAWVNSGAAVNASFTVVAGTYREVDPISRIEGHLGVALAVGADGKVKEAEVHGNLFRGFENFLIGREPNDPITYTQRICGVCPVPHGLTATYAADAVLGYSNGYLSFVHKGTGDGVPAKAVLIRNLVQSCDMLMSSITHFYHLAAQCYIQGPAMPPWTPFFNKDYYDSLLLNPGGPDKVSYTGAADTGAHTGALPRKVQGYSDSLWSAVITQYVKALRIRRIIFEAGAMFAGRMPMTSSFVAGGVTIKASDDLQTKCDKFADIMNAEVAPFIVEEYVPLALALGALYPAWDNKFNNGQEPGALDVGANYGFGAGLGHFLSWGGYPCLNDNVAFKGGHVEHPDASTFSRTVFLADRTQQGSAITQVETKLTESIAQSRYVNYNGEFGAEDKLEAYPGDCTRTQPDRDSGYSYLKAPRFDGKPREVGPLARLVVGGILVPGEGVVANLDSAGIPAGATYTTTVVGETGLKPASIEADLAVALVRDGLAELWMHNGTSWAVVNKSGTAGTGTPSGAAVLAISTLDEATITAAYTGTSVYGTPVIMGVVRDWVVGLKSGLSVMDRIRARALESLYLVLLAAGLSPIFGLAPDGSGDLATGKNSWIQQLKEIAGRVSPPAYVKATCRQLETPPGVSAGFGCNEAPRGSLAHFSTIDKGKITAYQCVVPYTWNGSPKDISGQRGPTEAAMIGIPYQALNSPVVTRGNVSVNAVGGVEALRVAQSFDPCIACAVH